MRAADERVEAAHAAGAVERQREAAVRRAQPQHGGVEAGPAHGARLHEAVVAAVDERARAELRRAHQVERAPRPRSAGARSIGQLGRRRAAASARPS